MFTGEHLKDPPSSMWHVAATSSMVSAATADDAVWLAPVLSECNQLRFFHAVAFTLTLQLMCLAAYVLCLLFGEALRKKETLMSPGTAIEIRSR